MTTAKKNSSFKNKSQKKKKMDKNLDQQICHVLWILHGLLDSTLAFGLRVPGFKSFFPFKRRCWVSEVGV